MTKNLERKKLDLFYLIKLVNQESAKISHLIKLKKVGACYEINYREWTKPEFAW